MKIKQKFVHREIVGENLLIPVGESSTSFNGIITMNDIATFIWNNIEESETEDDLLKKILSEYEVDEKTAKEDMEEFLNILRKVDII